MNNTREIKKIVKQRARDYLYGNLPSKNRTITLKQKQLEKLLALVWAMTIDEVDFLKKEGLENIFETWSKEAKNKNMNTCNCVLSASANAWQDVIKEL